MNLFENKKKNDENKKLKHICVSKQKKKLEVFDSRVDICELKTHLKQLVLNVDWTSFKTWCNLITDC